VREAADPQPVAAVAATPLPGRTVVAVPRSGVVAGVSRLVVVAPRSRGRPATGTLCGQVAASPGPRGGVTPKAGKQAASLTCE
jgi:hypothetical protein